MTQVTVLAATGRLGLALVRRLAAEGTQVIAVGRDQARLDAIRLPGVETRRADLTDPAALAAALADARLVVSCAHASHLPAILAALPAGGIERLVMMGSTRRFSAVPDATAQAVRDAEALLAAYPAPSVMLLATLIYGAGGSVVDRLAQLLRRCPVLPLPGGGRALVQPVHVEDVAAALAAALTRPEAPGAPIVVAGPQAMPYRDMVRAVARSRGLRVAILPLPAGPVLLAARLLSTLRPLAGTSGAIRRLIEDKAFDIGEMRRRLGVEPRPFAPG